MRVLVGCEYSGRVREAFKAKRHDAWSIDLLPTEIEGNHIQDDILKYLNDGWDLAIFHPPCTYLANSGVQHLYKDETRWRKAEQAKEFFLKLWNAPIEKIAIENPIPFSKIGLPKYSQIIQPFYFGEGYQKKTCLWLKNLPLLFYFENIVGRGEGYITKSGKKNGSKWYQLLCMKDRAKMRSLTFNGIAEAMADQWG